MKILIADDDSDLTDVTEFALRREGHVVIQAADGHQALASFQSERPDLILLDIGVDHLDGVEVCKRVRERSNVPVIMVTARDSESDMARAFGAGADDYIIKPFSFRQLIMRIGAVARRGQVPADSVLRADALRLDTANGEVTIHGEPVRLTRLEFRILHCLLANRPQVASFERLLQFAWPTDRGDMGVLKTHISHLRTKLGLNQPGAQLTIENVPGIGYRLRSALPHTDCP